jgi:hypothetical protein
MPSSSWGWKARMSRPRPSAGGGSFGSIVAGAAMPSSPGCSRGAKRLTGKFKSSSRVRKLVRGITQWQPTSSPGREVAVVSEPVPFARPLAQYAVRTPSKEKAGGYYQAVLFTTRVKFI